LISLYTESFIFSRELPGLRCTRTFCIPSNEQN
jgi:hypothetical protein